MFIKAEPKCKKAFPSVGGSSYSCSSNNDDDEDSGKEASKKVKSLVIKREGEGNNNSFKWCPKKKKRSIFIKFLEALLLPFINSRIMLIGFPLLLLFHNTTESMTNPKTIDWKPLGKDRHPDLAYLESLLKLPGTEVQIGQRFELNEAKPAEMPKSLPANKNPTISTSLQTIPQIMRPPLIGEMKIKMDRALKLRSMADGIEELLYRTLLDPNYYEKDVRPTPHHSLPTNVTFGFLLNQIVEMDERNQILQTRCWLNINWLDKRLSWNSTEWEGVKTLYIPYKNLWKPDIILVNNAVREYYGSILSTDVMVTADGNVTWLFSALFKSSCQLKVRYYPFDGQECVLKFSSWSHDISEIDLRLTTNQGDLSSYLNSTEFDLTEMSAMRVLNIFPTDNESLWPTIAITIKMERRPLFYVFNHIIPCILISSMAVFGFLMPPETGEKINLSITTMLSMGVYLQSITESIPPTSEAVPLIGQYYVGSLFIVCLATATNVVSLNVHRTGVTCQGRHVPRWMEKFILGYMATIMRMTIHEPDSITLLKSSQNKRSTIRRSSLLRDLKKIRETKSYHEDKQQELCECLTAEIMGSFSHTFNNSNHKITEIEFERPNTGESAFLQRLVAEQVMPRMSQKKPEMLNEFEERFKKILKRIYRSLQQREIRDEIMDERKRIMWQWQSLAEVVDRFLLFTFAFATAMTIASFLVLPVTLRDYFNWYII